MEGKGNYKIIKNMSDQCIQYKKDYEKLLELKQEFDAALASGEVKKDFTEAKILREELNEAIENLKKEVIWEYRTLEVLKKMKIDNIAEDEMDDFIKHKCTFDFKEKTVIINSELILKNEFFPDRVFAYGVIKFSSKMKKIGDVSAGTINCCDSDLEEAGSIKACHVGFLRTPIRKIKSIECVHLHLVGCMDLQELPENCKIEHIYISSGNKELHDSALRLQREGKIKNIHHE